MRKFKVNTDSMHSTYRSVKAEVDELDRALQDMRSSVNELNETWVGSNSFAFSSQFRESCKKMEGLVLVLRTYIETYKKSASEYEACESEVSGLAAF